MSEPQTGKSDRLRLIVSLILGALVLIFVLQNIETVQTRILFITVSMPHAIGLLVTLLTGFAIGLLVAWHRRRRSEVKATAAKEP